MEEWVNYKKWVKKVDFDNFSYYFTNTNIAPISIIKFKGLMHFGNATFRNIEEDQKQFELELNIITTRYSKNTVVIN